MEPVSKAELKDGSAKLRIAIDNGGVLSVSAHDNEGDHNNIKADFNVPGVFEALQKLKDQGHELFMVSYCGKKRAQATMAYVKSLEADGKKYFDGVYFTKNRKDKNQICKHLGAHIMIDDREDVLVPVKKLNPEIQCCLFGSSTFPDWPTVVEWCQKVPISDINPEPLPEAKIRKLCYVL